MSPAGAGGQRLLKVVSRLASTYFGKRSAQSRYWYAVVILMMYMLLSLIYDACQLTLIKLAGFLMPENVNRC